MKKKLIIISLIVAIFAIVLTPKLVGADSGWDSSYSSSSSSSSSSSWSSSSSSSSWSSSGSSTGGSGEFTLLTAIFMEAFVTIHYVVFVFVPIGTVFKKYPTKKVVIILLILRVILLTILNCISINFAFLDFILLFILAFTITPLTVFKGMKKPSVKKHEDIRNDILEKYGIDDKEKLKQDLYNKYVDIQESWMNFDYDKLRTLLSDSLFNMYKQQLEALKLKDEKNMMHDFEYIDSKIYDISEKNNTLTLKVYLNVKMYDYVVDRYNNVVKGNKNKKIDIHYEIVFEKSLSKSVDTCPNCGGKITDYESNKCPHCKAIIINNSKEFVMSKKTNIKQN